MITITGTGTQKFLDFDFAGDNGVRKNLDKIYVGYCNKRKKEVIIWLFFGKMIGGEFTQVGNEFEIYFTKTNAQIDAYSTVQAHIDAKAFLEAQCKDTAIFTIS